jgi:hypothetical protein
MCGGEEPCGLASIRGGEERPVAANISDVEEQQDVPNPEETSLMICWQLSIQVIIQ